jgi:2-methylisocitrate lyase-like PEP mutase family enzyme
MVEFGKTPLLPAERLGTLGYSLIIYPGAITRSIVPAARAVLSELAVAGTTSGWLDRMATFQEVNSVLGLDEANSWESEIADRARKERSK